MLGVHQGKRLKMFTHKAHGMEDHQHALVSDARACEEEFFNAPYDEDGEIAMMRVLETDEVQRMETDYEERMVQEFSAYNVGVLPDHRQMTGLELIHYREKCDIRQAPPRSRRLHHIDETCNCPNSYARCHLFQNCKQKENV
jgi:hypothetical protein